MPLDRLMFPLPGKKIAFWKITEDAEMLLQMYNPTAEEIVFLQGLHESKRLHFLSSRLLLRTLFPEGKLTKDEVGKPHFEEGSPHLSISHSGNFAAAIIDENGPTGIDIETQGPKILRIEDKFCNAEDKSNIRKTHLSVCLLIIWGAKESLYKWYGKKEVDFKKHMTVGPFETGDSGRFSASFHKPGTQQDFIMEYAVFDGHVAVWIHELL